MQHGVNSQSVGKRRRIARLARGRQVLMLQALVQADSAVAMDQYASDAEGELGVCPLAQEGSRLQREGPLSSWFRRPTPSRLLTLAFAWHASADLVRRLKHLC